MAPLESRKVDFDDLERYFSKRLDVTSKILSLVEDGSPKCTIGTLNSAALEIAKVRNVIKDTQEKLDQWKTAIKKVTIVDMRYCLLL